MTTSFGELLSLSVYLKRNFPLFLIRLLDIVHADQKLYLVFEFLDVDLKRYIETGNQNRTPISLQIVKVRLVLLSQEQIFVRVFVTRFKKLTYFFHSYPQIEVHLSTEFWAFILPLSPHPSSGFKTTESSH